MDQEVNRVRSLATNSSVHAKMAVADPNAISVLLDIISKG